MAYTFLTLAQEVADQMDWSRPSTLEGSGITQETRRLKQAIIAATKTLYMALAKNNEYREAETTFSTTGGTGSYNIPSALETVEWLAMADDPPLRIIPHDEFELNYKRASFIIEPQAAPNVAAIFKRQIHLFPTPDTTYTVTVRGKAKYAEPSLDADTFIYTPEDEPILRELAIFYCMKYEANPQMNDQLGLAQELLKIKRRTNRNHGELPARIISEEEYVRNLDFYRIDY